MTVSVKQALDKICNDNIFSDELYFTGGTALAFYLNHRVSETSKALPYKKSFPLSQNLVLENFKMKM